MKESNKLAELTLEQLHAKKKTTTASVIGLGIVMLIALITLIYLAIKGKNYALIAVGLGSSMTFMPILIYLNQLNAELKARALE